jgi:hypothetical protein
MALNVRLHPQTERALNALARRHRLSRSEVVREAIAHYAAAQPGEDASQPYQAWVDVIGIVNVGARDPRRTTGEQFADIVGRKRARRSR